MPEHIKNQSKKAVINGQILLSLSLSNFFFVNIIITIISLLNKTVRVKSLQTAYPVPVDFQPDGLLKLLIRYWLVGRQLLLSSFYSRPDMV